RQPLLVGVEDDGDARLRPRAGARLPVGAQGVEQRGEPALHVVHAGPPRPPLRIDVERPLLGGAGPEHGVVVADEEKALGARARLLADEVVAEALGGDAAELEAQALQPLGEDGAGAGHVQHVVGAAAVVHEAREKVDLLVPPAIEAVPEVAHARYGNLAAPGAERASHSTVPPAAQPP